MSDSYKQFKMYSKDQVKRGASDKKYGTLCLKKMSLVWLAIDLIHIHHFL